MTAQVHMVVGLLVIGANLLAGIWGGVAWVRRRSSRIFWVLLRFAQAVVVVQVVIGFVLIAAGASPAGNLHLLYGVAPVVVALVTEAMRAGATQRELADVDDVEALDDQQRARFGRRILRREMGIMAVGALVIVSLALRAYSVGGA